MKKTPKKKEAVIDLLHRGYNQKDKKAIEFYDTVLNDLAEDIDIRGRLTKANLIEVIGYLERELQNSIDRLSSLRLELIGLATKSLSKECKARKGEADTKCVNVDL